MAATKGIVFDGMPELDKLLDTIAPREVQNLLRTVVHGIAGAVRDEIKQHAPVRTGNLRQGIKAVRRGAPFGQAISDVIAQTGKGVKHNAFYWRFVEFGTKHAHAEPFVVPTVESFRPKIQDVYREQFGKKLEKALERHAAKVRKS